jgi:oligosaccharyltransferase complex subunit delta (ribophorin II)
MIHRLVLVLCLAAALAAVSSSTSVNSNYPHINALGLKKIFDGAKPYADLSNAYYSIKGNSLLGETLSAQNAIEVCTFVKSKVDKTNIESVFYGTSLAASISNCALPVADFEAVLNSASNSQKVVDLYYYVQTAINLKKPIDAKKISKSVLDGLKADTSILNQGYSLQIATLLSENNKVFYDNIEDILDQADEVDKKYLQYEGGVGTTSLILDGIFELSGKQKQFPAKFTQDRLGKFINYLTSKRFPTNIKSAYFLLKLSKTLSENQFHIPLIVNRISPVGLSGSQPHLVVSLTNILGDAVKQAQFNLEAESGKSQKPNAGNLVSAKKTFTSKSSDGSTFELKLIDAAQQPSAGFYTIVVTATPKGPHVSDKRFFLVANSVEVKVTTQISIADLQLGVADRDQAAPKLTK